jgi:hypothetical protein
MHTLHRIHRGCDLVIHIGANTCTIEVDSAPRCIVMTGQTLANFEEIVANTVDGVLLQQWLFMHRPIETAPEIHICKRCGVRAPGPDCCPECE